MTPGTILVADDEPDMLDLVNGAFAREGFTVLTAPDGQCALEEIRRARPDLAVLDLMMPFLTGIEVCREVRAQPETAGIPLIILSAQAAEVDRVIAFEVGADDYVLKPFSPRELLLRVRAILRHRRPEAARRTVWQTGEITLDSERHSVLVAGESADLTPVEYKLLRILMEAPGQVHSREALLRELWGDRTVELRTVDTQVRRLRARLGHAAAQIETIRSFGYRITALC